jgi:hypothetical protein
VNSAGNVYITGSAGLNLPVTSGAFQAVQGGGSSTDAFVTEFDGTGSSLIYSTYLGGINNDSGAAIALDSGGNAYVTGITDSYNFPLELPLQTTYVGGVPEAFVAELNSSGSQLLFSTYWGGGVEGYGLSQGNALAVNGSGNIYFGGNTSTPDFPVLNAIQPGLAGVQNGFVAKVLNQSSPANAIMTLSSPQLEFNPNPVGTSVQQTLNVKSVGSLALKISSITANGDFSETNTCSSPLQSGQSCSIVVTFTPTDSGLRTGVLTISSNAQSVSGVVQLSGTGEDFGLQVSPGTASVSPGVAATYTVLATFPYDFPSIVSLTCSGAPKNSTCSISPASVAVNQTATLTISTTGTSAAKATPTWHRPYFGKSTGINLLIRPCWNATPLHR